MQVSWLIYYTYIKHRHQTCLIQQVDIHKCPKKIANYPSIQHLRSSHQTTITVTPLHIHFLPWENCLILKMHVRVQRFHPRRILQKLQKKHRNDMKDNMMLSMGPQNLANLSGGQNTSSTESFLVHQTYPIQQQITRYTGSVDKKLIEVPLHPCAPNSDLASTFSMATKGGWQDMIEVFHYSSILVQHMCI